MAISSRLHAPLFALALLGLACVSTPARADRIAGRFLIRPITPAARPTDIVHPHHRERRISRYTASVSAEGGTPS
jgi:hypothetical protein